MPQQTFVKVNVAQYRKRIWARRIPTCRHSELIDLWGSNDEKVPHATIHHRRGHWHDGWYGNHRLGC